MFLDESAFDEIDEIKVTSKFSSRPATALTSSNSNTLHLDELEEEDNDLPAFRSAGTLGTPSSSRARMLSQQREILMKKRSSSMQNGGMVRSSIDSVSSPAKSEGQFTPAARQFSAPKAVKDVNVESEFQRPAARPTTATRSQPTRKSSRYSDEDEEEEQYARKGNSPKPNKRGDDDDYNYTTRSPKTKSRSNMDDYDDARRGVKDMRLDDNRNKNRNRRDEEDEDDYRKSNNRSSNNGRDNNNRRGYEEENDRERNDDYRWDGARSKGDDRDRERDNRNDRNANNNKRDDRRDYNDRNGNNNSNVAQDNTQDKAAPARPVIVPPDLSNMRRFLTTPIPKTCGVVQCYIRRNKSGTHKLFPVYSLYLKEGDIFLMASKKRPKNKTSNYLISMDQNDLNRSGSSYLGKLRSNFVGTEFQVFDDGINPKDTDGDEIAGANSAVRCELGAVMYAANVLGSRGPRKMQVAIPALDNEDQIMRWKDGHGPNGPGDDMLTRMKDRNFRDLTYLINKPPRWNEQVGAYVLNFNGRVTMASVKNFQLVDPEEQNAVVLQFGRVGKDEFTMDLQYPMSPFQAFALTLSSFDSKIACD